MTEVGFFSVQLSVLKYVFQRRWMSGQNVAVPSMWSTSQRTAYSNASGCEPVYSSVPPPRNFRFDTVMSCTGFTCRHVMVRSLPSGQPFL